MFSFLKIEGTTKDVAVSRFLLMLGYKLFAFYFPLFLIEKGLSLPQVGYAFVLIYLPMALFSPVAGFLNHRVNPALLMTIGTGGYAAYSIGMLILEKSAPFFLFQVLLGVSAALFLVSSRAILMGLPAARPDRSFGWFYAAPFYTDVLGPILGALFIFTFGFVGVFLASLAVYACAMFYIITTLHTKVEQLKDRIPTQTILGHYTIFISSLKKTGSRALMTLAFVALVTGGVYHAFFLLFLQGLGWTRNELLSFGVLTAALFTPLSLAVIWKLGRDRSRRNILQGLFLYSVISLVFGTIGRNLSFIGAVVLTLLKDIGSFVANAGRSGQITTSFSRHPEEAAAIDTMFSPLGQSAGFLAAGLLIGKVGYSFLFIASGLLVLFFLAWAVALKSDKTK